jgi:cytochrome d ubiquinol oxidase subunit I
MKLDPSTLARIQFAFTVSFHIMVPTMSIGLASFLAVIEALWLKTKNPLYLQIYKFWLSIFAMSFGIGVVTGIVLSFEFGLGFAHFAEIAGPAIGPMIALEVLTAFFLEAGFLGIMLFGLHRVGPRLHFFAAGCRRQPVSRYMMAALTVVDWLHVVANPSWPYRLPHMLTAA